MQNSRYLDRDRMEARCSNSRNISCCCDLASAEPVPPRPVFWIARSIGVEPLLFWSTGSAPYSSRVPTAVAQRVRTARCYGVTPRLSIAFGSAPASIRQMIVAACAGGFHVREPGRPTAAACSASSPKRFLAWTSAPAVMSFLRTRRCAMPCRSRRIEVVCLRRLTSGSRLKTCTCQRR